MQLQDYFALAVEKKASDLHLVSGNKPTLRIDGALQTINDEVLDGEALLAAILQLIPPEDAAIYKTQKEHDLALKINGANFRVNLHQQEGTIGLTARVVPSQVPSPQLIGFDEVLYNLTHLNQGLILVTGPSGSGKSTTLAALLDIINKERKAHIITIEDPIEYLFTEQQSIIEQRELGRDTSSFAEALKRALRQDPNVIMVGEMRDLETISATLTAAETGHLVLSTLHTNSAAETIERIVDSFPAHQQKQIFVQLASTLRAIISQQLIAKADGGLIAVREVLINTPAIANLIREGKIAQIPSAMQTGRQEGMITIDGALKQLFEQGLITEQVYRNRLGDTETLSTYY